MDIESILSLIEYLFPIVLGIVTCIVTFVRTGKIKSINNTTCDTKKEIEDMVKYLTADKPKEKVAQEFVETKKGYYLDPVSNELKESPVPVDFHAQIQSYIDVALERALEKFLPKTEVQDVDVVADYTKTQQDLSVIGQAYELAEDYREKYNLPDDYTVDQIYKYVGMQAKELESKLNKINNKEVKTNGEEEKVE